MMVLYTGLANEQNLLRKIISTLLAVLFLSPYIL